MRPEPLRPETRYAKAADGSYVAYQVFGRGPRHRVFVPSFLTNLDVTSEILDLTAPSVAHDPRFRAWFLRYQRLAMSRGTATVQYRWVTQLDVRSVLPSIRVPTLVLHRTDARHHRVAFGRHLRRRHG
jgi:pimeloyl-ACP methyl ester carboxylesterase